MSIFIKILNSKTQHKEIRQRIIGMSGYPSQFYRPYDSGDESGTESDTESQDSWYSSGSDQQVPSSNIPNFVEFAQQLKNAAGRSFSTIQDELTYGTDKLGKYTVYSQYDAPPPDLEGGDTYGKTTFNTADGSETSIIMIDSRYRDRTAYPQPTYCKLQLPRVYKNITNINVVEMKLLTSFYFFRPSKGNTDISIHEKDRITYTYEGNYQSTIVKTNIRTGSYNINQLQDELNTQLNYVPLFFDFVNGFDDFITIFRASGDFGVNFNEPGDYFYNNTTNLFVPNPTKNTIVLHFWKTRSAGLTSYTVDQVLLAYYYPVLNEALQDEQYPASFINLTTGIGIDPTIATEIDVRNRILYYFTGINPPDPVVLAVIQGNIPNLDKYRLEHTFRYWLVNKYVVGREQQSQRVYFTTPSLNTSLVNLLNAQFNRFFLRALQLYNLTPSQYATIQSNVDRTLAVLSEMYNFEQEQFLNYFAVPWSQYTLSYYANLNNAFLLRNGTNATNIPSTDSEAIAAGVVPFSNDNSVFQTTPPSHWWPELTSLNTSSISLVNLSSLTSSFHDIYRLTTSNFDSNHQVVEAPNDYFYTEYLTKTVNVVCPIEAGKYNVFEFTSPVRQTLQVETLPRPPVYRLPLYNQSNFDSTINSNFDFNYTFEFTSTNTPYYNNNSTITELAYDNLPKTQLNTIPGWSLADASNANPNNTWARSFTSSISSYTSNYQIDVTSYNRALYFTFTTPEVDGASPSSNYTYDMNLSAIFFTGLTTSTITTPLDTYRLFLYHDRAAFQGDVLSNRNENNRFYKYKTSITPSLTSSVISFTTYPKETYYGILRPDPTTFGNAFVKLVPWFSSSFTVTPQSLSVQGLDPATDIYQPNFTTTLVKSNFNYAQVYDSNWIRLPIQSNLWPPEPTDYLFNQPITISNVPMGYDDANVSTDYTDYIPYALNSFTGSFTPNSNLGIDPITKYLFQSNSPYNSTTQTFLYGDGNSVFTPGLTSLYIPGIVPERQSKIVHYYSVNYIPESEEVFPLPSSSIGVISTAQKAYSLETTKGQPIPGYSYGGAEASTIQLSRGVMGFNFIPQEGIWDLKRIMFRSAIEDETNDPNRTIKYLGVYLMADLLGKDASEIVISSAICVLSNSATQTYTSTFELSNSSFDYKGGTYYEFQKDSSFTNPYNLPILGYYQPQATMVDQPESMYTAIAFNKYGVPTTIKALSGSAIPYPLYNDIYISTAYIDGTKAFNNSYGVVFPSTIGPSTWDFVGATSSLYAPPAGQDGTQSKYILSQPIGTTVLNYKQKIATYEDEFFFRQWSTNTTPTKVIATVSNFTMLQETNFIVYANDPNSPVRQFVEEQWNITPDDVFPSAENTPIVSVTGNSQYFYFLGFSNFSTYNYLRLKRLDPITGILTDYPLPFNFRVPINGSLNSFTINDAEQMVLSYRNIATNSTRFYYNTTPSTNMLQTAAVAGSSNAIHAMDPLTSTLYWMPIDASNKGTTVYQTIIQPSPAFPGTQWIPQVNGNPVEWTGIAVNDAASVPASYDRLLLTSLSTSIESNVYYASTFTAGPNTIEMRAISTPIQVGGTGLQIGTMTTGYKGGIWLTASATPGGQPTVWGNRNSDPDQTGRVETAWQIFYPFQKIVMEKTANAYISVTDSNFLNYPEYPHVNLFYYSNAAKFAADTNNKWGLEVSTNYTVCDTQLQGFNFNGYIYNIPLQPSTAPNYQYITVRGYTPTEQFETMLRFNLPNKYDFGYITSLELINEISSYTTQPTLYNQTYTDVLFNFDGAFYQLSNFYGDGLIPGFDGSNIQTSNFQQFSSNVSTIYAGYQSNANLLTNINNFVNSNLNVYISTQLQYILPPSAQNRQKFTDPLIFSILWFSGLLPQYRALLEDWGLGYNLGFEKRDTPYSTYHRASSFYKILEDYIYLRLNPELQMNRLDTTYREDLKITRDSTGQVNNHHGKLLLNDFNTFSRSFVSNQVTFNPPIGKLGHMSFEWINLVGDQIDNNDCEWSCSLSITENRQKATVQSTLPALPKK